MKKQHPLSILGLILFLCSLAAATPLSAQTETGYAVFYADYLEGQKTANGEIFSNHQLTCAHKTHPFGTLLKITRLDNYKSVTVRVNDRGPYGEGLVVDLTKAAAAQLGMLSEGKAYVQVEVVGSSNTNPIPPSLQTAKSPSAIPTEYSSVSTTKVKDPYLIRELPAGLSGYGLQIGAYTNRANAERQLIALQKQGIDKLYIKSLPGGRYKLVVASFPTRDAAMQYLQSLKQQYFVEGFPVNLSKWP